MKIKDLNYIFDENLTINSLLIELRKRKKSYKSPEILDLLLHSIILKDRYKDLKKDKYSQS
ncbi:hypothetical protein BH24ACI1_BH24ACI1_24100 [soil metagenome]|jgi:hypothetical protein